MYFSHVFTSSVCVAPVRSVSQQTTKKGQELFHWWGKCSTCATVYLYFIFLLPNKLCGVHPIITLVVFQSLESLRAQEEARSKRHSTSELGTITFSDIRREGWLHCKQILTEKGKVTHPSISQYFICKEKQEMIGKKNAEVWLMFCTWSRQEEPHRSSVLPSSCETAFITQFCT